MKSLKLLLGTAFFLALFITGCQKDVRKNDQVSSSTASLARAKATKEKLQKIMKSLPAGYEKRIKVNAPILLQTHPEYHDMILRILKVVQTECDGNTELNQWLSDQLSDWDDEVIFYALATGMLNFPQYDALLFENSSANQYFGLNGEYSQRLTKTFKDLQRFWNIQSKDIVLAAMHGNMLLDKDRVIKIDQILYGDSEADAEYWADIILQLMDIFPQYRNGDHPIFTFNAYAQPSFNFPPYGTIPNKIIMGDGVLDGYTAIGYKDVAPQTVVAHEFGHHIQFQLGLYDGENSPEATRRNELMADAFSAYFLSHARGASMQWKRVQEFLVVFFNIGDCAVSSPGHHGTPAQRMASAEWAYHLADNAQKQGHVLTAQDFVTLFDAELPDILAH